MTQPTTSKTEAALRFADVDPSIDHDQRGLFCLAARKEVKDIPVEINDVRTDSRIVKGSGGLDAQGFAYIRHHSALQDSDSWFSGQNIEDTYIPEMCDLVCKATGAKKAIAINSVFRGKPVDLQLDPLFYFKRGSELDVMLSHIPKDKAQGKLIT